MGGDFASVLLRFGEEMVVLLDGFLLIYLSSDFGFEYWELCMRYRCPFSLILSFKHGEIAEIFIKT